MPMILKTAILPECKAASQTGFTLLEMTVVIILVSILSLLFLSAFQQGGRILSVIITDRNELQGADYARAFLSRLISRAFPFDADRSGTSSVVPFSGTSSEVYFSAALDVAPRHDDLYRIRVWYDQAQSQVRMAHTADRNDLEVSATATGSALLSDVQSVQFRYLDVTSGVANWLTDWSGRQDLPEAVGIDVNFITPTAWPSLVVTLPITGRQYCQFDPVSRRCR